MREPSQAHESALARSRRRSWDGESERLDPLKADRHTARLATLELGPCMGIKCRCRRGLAAVDIAPMSKFREHDFGTFDRVDAAVVSHAEAPGIRSSRQEPSVAFGPSTPRIFPQEFEGRGEPSLDVAWQLSEPPFRADRELDLEVGQRIASEVEFLLNLGPGPSGFPVQPPQVFEEKLLGRVGVEEIVEELIVADAPNFVTSQPVQSLRADGNRRKFAFLGSHRSHDLHGNHHTYR